MQFLVSTPVLRAADKPSVHKPKNQWFLDLLSEARSDCVLAMPYQEFVDSFRFIMPDFSHRRPNHATKHSSWWNPITRQEALGSKAEDQLVWEEFFRPRTGAVNGFDCLHALAPVLRTAIMTTEDEMDSYRGSRLDPLLRFPYILLLPRAAGHFSRMVMYNLLCCSPAVQLCTTNYAPISRQLFPSYEAGRKWFMSCEVSPTPPNRTLAVRRGGDVLDVILYGPFGSFEVYKLGFQKVPRVKREPKLEPKLEP